MLNMTQSELAQVAGMERRIIARLETPALNVQIQHLVKLKQTFEQLGIEFTDGTRSYGSGVRWKNHHVSEEA